MSIELVDFNTSENTELVLSTSMGFTKLSRLEYGPAYFLKRLTEEEVQDYFDFGKLVHAILLQPEKVEEFFYFTDFTPSEGKWTTFIKTLFETRKLVSTQWNEDEWYKNAYSISGLASPKLEGAIEKFKNEIALEESYYNILKNSEGKIIMGVKDDSRAEACANSLLNLRPKEYADYLILPTLSHAGSMFESSLTYFPELKITWSMKGFAFTIESTLDLVVIDKKLKKIIVFDVKTTSKNVFMTFGKSYKEYGYYRQAALYLQALKAWFGQQLINIDDYTVEYVIAAVQVMEPYSATFYRPSENDVAKGDKENLELLHRLKWHVDNNVWDRPKEFHEAGIMTLNLSDIDDTETQTKSSGG